MSTDSLKKAEAFRNEVLKKINKAVQEFAEGKLSAEQFQAIYTRYTEHLSIANMAVMSGQEGSIDAVQNDGTSTIALRNNLQGKAMGLMIYHNKSGTIVETLGNPDVPIDTIGPLFNEISIQMESGKRVEPVIKKLGEKQWLALAAGRFTTIATQFRHEPARQQILELERLHTDFEDANKVALQRATPDTKNMAYPFVVFVEKRIKQ